MVVLYVLAEDYILNKITPLGNYRNIEWSIDQTYNKSKQFRAQVIAVKLNKLLDLVKKMDT